MEAAEGNLSTVPTVDDDAVTVVLASEGLPEQADNWSRNFGVDAALAIDGGAHLLA